MNGIWVSLTPQGKLVLAAGIVSVFIILGLLFRGGDGQSSNAGPVTLPTAVLSPTPTQAGAITLVTVTPSATAPAGVITLEVPQSTSTVQPTATALATAAGLATATAPATATSGPIAPTAVPTSTTQPTQTAPTATPTAVPTPGCSIVNTVVASVASEDDTVSAKLVCDGEPVSNTPMSAFFSYETSVLICESLSNGEGVGICRASDAISQEGQVQSITICFDHDVGLICDTINRT